jgi:ribA/ribD-fused uncharacterized protein
MKFHEQYYFLSNFYPAWIEVGTITFPTVEHAYQACKTHSIRDRIAISKLRTPGQAKRYGRTVEMRDGWTDLRIPVMLALLVAKFSYTDLQNKLIATYPLELVEDNDWGDDFWGRYHGSGDNHLGILLMEVRNKLYDAQMDRMNGEEPDNLRLELGL